MFDGHNLKYRPPLTRLIDDLAEFWIYDHAEPDYNRKGKRVRFLHVAEEISNRGISVVSDETLNGDGSNELPLSVAYPWIKSNTAPSNSNFSWIREPDNDILEAQDRLYTLTETNSLGGNDDIERWALDGTDLGRVAVAGPASSNLNDIDADLLQIAVLNATTNTVEFWDKSGTRQSTYDISLGSPSSNLSWLALAITPTRLYVVEGVILTINQGYVRVWNRTTKQRIASEDITLPFDSVAGEQWRGIAVTKTRIYVWDDWNDKVVVYQNDDNHTRQSSEDVNITGSFYAFTANDERFYFTGGNHIDVYDHSGTVQSSERVTLNSSSHQGVAVSAEWVVIGSIATNAPESTESDAKTGNDSATANASRMTPRRTREAMDAYNYVRFASALAAFTTNAFVVNGEVVFYNSTTLSATTNLKQNINLSEVKAICLPISGGQAPFGDNASNPQVDEDAIDIRPILDAAIDSKSHLVFTLTGNNDRSNPLWDSKAVAVIKKIAKDNYKYTLSDITWGETGTNTPDQGSVSLDFDIRLSEPTVLGEVSGYVAPDNEGLRRNEFLDDPRTLHLTGWTMLDANSGTFTGANGQIIATQGTGQNPDIIFAVAYNDSSGISHKDDLSLAAGDEFLVKVGSAYIFGTLKSQEADQDNSTPPVDVAWRWIYTLDNERGEDSYNALPAGAADIYIRKDLSREYAKLDGTNINDTFRSAVQRENEDVQLGSYTLKSSVGSGLSKGEYVLLDADGSTQNISSPTYFYVRALDGDEAEFQNGVWSAGDLLTFTTKDLANINYRYTLKLDGGFGSAGTLWGSTVSRFGTASASTPVTDSASNITLLNEDVHRPNLVATVFKALATGAADRYAKTDGSGDSEWQTPVTNIGTDKTSKTLTTEGAVVKAIENHSESIIATNAENSFASGVYTISPTPALNAYTEGTQIIFDAAAANVNVGGSTKVNISSLGDKTIVKEDGSQLSDGDIPADYYVHLIYDGIFFVYVNRPTAGIKNWQGTRRELRNAGSQARSSAASAFTSDSLIKVTLTPDSTTQRFKVRGSLVISRNSVGGAIIGAIIQMKKGTGSYTAITNSSDSHELLGTLNLTDINYLDWIIIPIRFEYEFVPATTDAVEIAVSAFLYNQSAPNKYNNGTIYWNSSSGYNDPGATFGAADPISWLEVTKLADGNESITLQSITTRDT